MSNHISIKVIDAIMGTGKSEWAIRKIQQNPEGGPYVIATPLLSEVERYAEGIDGAVSLYDGEDKLIRFKEALLARETVVCTHSLFQLFDQECFEMAYEGDYSLYLDETVSLVEELPITPQDYLALKGTWLLEEETGKEGFVKAVPVDNIEEYEGEHEWFLKMVRTGHIFILKDSQGNEKVVLLVVPPEKLSAFNEICIMTYLFNGSDIIPLFKEYGVGHEHLHLSQGPQLPGVIGSAGWTWELSPHDGIYTGRDFKNLLEVYEGKLNNIGDRKTKRSKFPLSWGWYNSCNKKTFKDSENFGIKRLKLNLRNYFRGVDKDDILWTCPKMFRNRVADRFYHTKKNPTWLAVNTRATNDYADKHYVAICQDLYPRMPIQRFFTDRGKPIDKDAHALSMALQFIWRSAIRNGEKTCVYLPSARMRNLVKKWLTGEIKFDAQFDLKKAA